MKICNTTSEINQWSTPSPTPFVVEIALTILLPPLIVTDVSEWMPSSVEFNVFVPLIIFTGPYDTIVLG